MLFWAQRETDALLPPGGSAKRRSGCEFNSSRPGTYVFLLPAALALLFNSTASDAFGMSPMTDFRGQRENAGHFLQPTAIAIGQSVMAFPYSCETACETAKQGNSETGTAKQGHPQFPSLPTRLVRDFLQTAFARSDTLLE